MATINADTLANAKCSVSVWADAVKDAEDHLDWLRDQLADSERRLRDLEAEAEPET